MGCKIKTTHFIKTMTLLILIKQDFTNWFEIDNLNEYLGFHMHQLNIL
jgi:hypothetical protein